MKTGLIDVGGGSRDIYGAGVLDFCLDHGITFDYCIGISAGSANLASFLAGQRGRNYVFYTEYFFRKEYASLHNMLVKHNYVDLDYVYDTLSNSEGEYPIDFKAMYENRWSYEKMMKDNLEDCFQMALKWRNDNGCNDDEEKNAEMCVTLNSLRLFEELELTGGVLRLDGEIIAFTMGEPVSEDTFVVHIEKAFADVQGAYPMINQQFVSNECGEYQYINREEDTGAEGLRKAKLSYRPVFLVEKGVVKEKER